MSVSNFIPALWSARLLANLQASHVYANVVNRDYEGEIKSFGDRVKINSIGKVTIGSYDGTDIAEAEDLNGGQVELVIDKANYFNFQVDDVDKAQANVSLMDAGMTQAGYDLSDAFDKEIAKAYLQAGLTMGSDSAPKVLTPANVYATIVDAGVELDEANASKVGRFMVVAPFVHGMLLKAPEFIRATDLGDNTVTNGFVGKAGGFDIYVSNNVPNSAGTKYKVLAGTRQAISVAEQILKVEAYRPEKRFSDAVKGLHVFGIKVIQPNALVCLTVNKA